jgi:hypothetical protein
MDMPAYYPYSRTYLREHMSRISRGIVVVGLGAIAWLLVIFVAIAAGTFLQFVASFVWQVLT